MANDRDAESVPVQITRCAIANWVLEGMVPARAMLPSALPPEIPDRAACFVSLHRNGDLRGCIGTIAPTMENTVSEIVRNAVSACSEDPRFDPVRPDELEGLEISVDILGASEPVASSLELDPKKYGVIVTAGARRGLLLPDLDGVDTAEMQLAIACRKGGIMSDEPYAIQRFTVTRYH
jgi:MEMO1 family protein